MVAGGDHVAGFQKGQGLLGVDGQSAAADDAAGGAARQFAGACHPLHLSGGGVAGPHVLGAQCPAEVRQAPARASHASVSRLPPGEAGSCPTLCRTGGSTGAEAAFGYGVTVTEFRDAFSRQARVRHREEQNTAERRCSTPAVHPRPQTGHVTSSPRCIAATRRRACSNARHRRDLHLPEQNTAAADFVGGSGPTLPAIPSNHPTRGHNPQHPDGRAVRPGMSNTHLRGHGLLGDDGSCQSYADSGQLGAEGLGYLEQDGKPCGPVLGGGGRTCREATARIPETLRWPCSRWRRGVRLRCPGCWTLTAVES